METVFSIFKPEYIDFRVLVLLFCLMLVVAGWQETGLFKAIAVSFSKRVHTSRAMTFVLSSLCFFTSMIITNDVALITFVPFTILLFKEARLEKKLIPVICFETIAANMGSTLTPIGNPQNLYIFSKSNMSVFEFLHHMLPLTLISGIIICFFIFSVKNAVFIIYRDPDRNTADKMLLSYGNITATKKFRLLTVAFFVCLMNVFGIVHYIAALLFTLIAVLLTNPGLIKKADYKLLLTFFVLFIFIGNISRIEAISSFISNVISGHEVVTGAILSQFISNVPATMLLSGFTQNYSDLIIGTDIGGLGTLIASMASLISFKYYISTEKAEPARYIAAFTAYNVIPLIILLILFH